MVAYLKSQINIFFQNYIRSFEESTTILTDMKIQQVHSKLF